MSIFAAKKFSGRINLNLEIERVGTLNSLHCTLMCHKKITLGRQQIPASALYVSLVTQLPALSEFYCTELLNFFVLMN